AARFEHERDLRVAFDVLQFLRVRTAADVDLVAHAEVADGHRVREAVFAKGGQGDPSRAAVHEGVGFFAGHLPGHWRTSAVVPELETTQGRVSSRLAEIEGGGARCRTTCGS